MPSPSAVQCSANLEAEIPVVQIYISERIRAIPEWMVMITVVSKFSAPRSPYSDKKPFPDMEHRLESRGNSESRGHREPGMPSRGTWESS